MNTIQLFFVVAKPISHYKRERNKVTKILERSEPTLGAQLSARVYLLPVNTCFIKKKSTLFFKNSSEMALFLP